MKRSDLNRIVREELERALSERTVSSWTPPREMTKSQVARRDKLGKSMLASKKATSYFKNKHGSDWESYLWASATNKSIAGGE